MRRAHFNECDNNTKMCARSSGQWSIEFLCSLIHNRDQYTSYLLNKSALTSASVATKRKHYTMTTSIARRRRPRGQHPKRVDHGQELAPKPLPQYLEAHEVQAIIRAADDLRARLLMGGAVAGRSARLRGPVALEVADLSLDTELPTIRVRSGKGKKSRIVPVHPELGAAFQTAVRRAEELGAISRRGSISAPIRCATATHGTC